MKTILITGGGRGLGRATAERLAGLGHRVLLTARTAQAAERAVAEIRARVPKAQVEPRAVELSSMAEVRAFGEGLSAEGVVLDALFHCAGVMQQSEQRLTTVDGYEQTLAVNAFAPFLLTSTLLPALRRAPNPRVVTVSSRLHLPGSRGAQVAFDFDDPQLSAGYNPDRAYKNSKLAVLWFTFELQRRFNGLLTANSVCPGFVPQTAANSTTGFQRCLLRYVLPVMPFARSIDEAVDSFAFMALDASLTGVGGGFYGEKHRIVSSPEALDGAKAKRFWELALNATGARWP